MLMWGNFCKKHRIRILQNNYSFKWLFEIKIELKCEFHFTAVPLKRQHGNRVLVLKCDSFRDIVSMILTMVSMSS